MRVGLTVPVAVEIENWHQGLSVNVFRFVGVKGGSKRLFWIESCRVGCKCLLVHVVFAGRVRDVLKRPKMRV